MSNILILDQEFLAWDTFSRVEEYPLIGKNRAMGEKQPQASSDITINATIHNVGSGIVAVGKDMVFLQKELYNINK